VILATGELRCHRPGIAIGDVLSERILVATMSLCRTPLAAMQHFGVREDS